MRLFRPVMMVGLLACFFSLGACRAAVSPPASGHLARPLAGLEGEPDRIISLKAGSGETELGYHAEDLRFLSPLAAAFYAEAAGYHSKAADYFAQVATELPDNGYVNERAFYEHLYAGHFTEAAALAARLIQALDLAPMGQEHSAGDDKTASKAGQKESEQSAAQTDQMADQSKHPDLDLWLLVHMVDAYQQKQWPLLRARAALVRPHSFADLLRPFLLAWSYAGEGNKRAMDAALDMLKNQPTMAAIAQEYRAYMLDHLGDQKGALEAYKTLLQDDRAALPQVAVAYAHLLLRLKKREEAQAVLAQAASRLSSNAYILREGYLLMRGGKPSFDPVDPQGAASLIFLRIANDLTRENSDQAALVYMRLAEALNPGSADIALGLGGVLERLSRFDLALEVYQSIPPQSLAYQKARLNMIEVLQVKGEPLKAEHILRDDLLKWPEDSQRLTMLADYQRVAGDYKEARLLYDRLIIEGQQGGSETWWLYFSRGICSMELGDFPAGEFDMEKALSISPDQPTLLNYLAYSWVERGIHLDKALKMLEKAVSLNPTSGAILDSLGWAHYRLGHYEDALLYLEKAVRLEPIDTAINDHLGDVYWQMGRRLEARFQWQHALDNGPGLLEKKTLDDKIALGFIADKDQE